MIAHEWIEVLNRRWCVCCTLYQHRHSASEPWPTVRRSCPRDTFYARDKDKELTVRLDHPLSAETK